MSLIDFFGCLLDRRDILTLSQNGTLVMGVLGRLWIELVVHAHDSNIYWLLVKVILVLFKCLCLFIVFLVVRDLVLVVDVDWATYLNYLLMGM